jgi:hypothetical protein
MTTTTSAVAGAELAPVDDPLFSLDEQAALAGFLAGYSGLTRDAYTLDLRQYTSWCTLRALHLFAARRVDVETFRGDMETAGRARATIARRLCTIAGFYRYAVEEELLDHSPDSACAPTAAGLRVARHSPGSQRARRAARGGGRARLGARARVDLSAGPKRAADQ